VSSWALASAENYLSWCNCTVPPVLGRSGLFARSPAWLGLSVPRGADAVVPWDGWAALSLGESCGEGQAGGSCSMCSGDGMKDLIWLEQSEKAL